MSGVSPKSLLSKISAGSTVNRACKATMKTLEYREGPEAKENFDKAMRTLFQTSKPTARKTKKAEPQSLRKKPRSDKN